MTKVLYYENILLVKPSFIKGYLLLIITLLILLAISVLAIREVSRKDWVKLYIIDRVEEATGKKVMVERVRFAFFPELLIAGEGLHIYEKDGTELLVSPKINVKLGLSTLILRRPVIRSLSLDRPRIFLKRDEKGELNILKDLTNGRKGLLLPVGRLSIKDGRVSFKDLKAAPLLPSDRNTQGHSIDIKNLNLLIDTPFFGEGLLFKVKGLIGRGEVFGEVRFEGKIEQNGALLEDAKFSIEGSFDNIDAAVFSPYLVRYGFSTLEGHLDGEVILNGGLKRGFLSGSIASREMIFSFTPYYPEPLNPKDTNLLFTVNYGEEYLYIEELNGSLDGVRLNGNLRLTFDTGEIEGRVDSSEITLPWLNAYMPRFEGWDLGVYLQYVRKGTIELEDVSFKGVFDDFFSMDTFKQKKPLKAKIGFKDVEVMPAEGYLPLRSLTGRMRLIGDTFAFEGVKGVYGETVLSELSGRVDRAFAHNPEIDLTVRSDIALEEVEPLLAAFYPQGKEWMGGFKDLTGRVDVSLRINKTIGKEGFGLKGEASIEEAGFFYLPKSLPPSYLPQEGGKDKGGGQLIKMSGLKGRLSFTPADIFVEDIGGLAGSSPFSLKGSIKGYNSKEPTLEIKVGYSLFARDLLTIIPLPLPEGIKMDGKLVGELLLSGKTSSIAIKNTTNLTELEYGLPDTFYKGRGIPSKVNIQGRYLKGGRFSNLLLILNLMDEELRVKGNVRDIAKLDGDWDIDFGEIELARLKMLLPLAEEYVHAGTIKGKVLLKGSLVDWKGMKTSGGLRILNASFIPSFGSVPIKNLTLTLRLENNRVDVPHLYIKRGESLIEGLLTIRGFKEPKVDFNLHAPLWRNRDFPPNERIKRLAKAFVKGGDVKGYVEVEKGELDRIAFQSLKASIVMKDEVWRVSPLEVNLQDGLFKGDIGIKPLKDGRNRYTMEMEWFGGDTEKVLKEWLEKERIMTGRFNAKAALLWEGGNKDEYLRSLSGSIKTEFEKGRIYKLFTTFPKLLALLNPLRVATLDLPSFTEQGMEYKRIQGVFRLDKGILSTEDLVIDGKEMRILWVGSVNIPDYTIDSVMAVQPFKTVDKILEKTVGKIPLIGEIVIGKDKKLFVLYYKVEGDLEDPDVRGMQVESVGKGILERFRMLLPVRSR